MFCPNCEKEFDHKSGFNRHRNMKKKCTETPSYKKKKELEKIKDILKEELKNELKNELKAELTEKKIITSEKHNNNNSLNTITGNSVNSLNSNNTNTANTNINLLN